MPRFSANVSILFTELPFIDRFAAARSAGFDAAECWFPYEHGVDEVARALRDARLTMVGINSAHGGAQEWGLAALPGREDDFVASVDEALDAARRFGNCAVHVMAGLAGAIPRAQAWATYLANLRRAVRRAQGSGVQLLIEPLNGRDRPGYLLNSSDRAAEVTWLDGLGSLRVMFDCYHVQVEEGDLVARLRRHWDRIGHLQIANPPNRNEPGRGEIDYRYVFDEIDRLGWKGWVGAEYLPSTPTTLESLDWFRAATQVLRS